MGMDLEPIAPAENAPKGERGPEWGRYNISGWSYIIDKLREWGVPLDEFRHFNDGDPISAETCAKVADAIESHLPEMSDRDRNWLGPHVERWRTCGGYRQW